MTKSRSNIIEGALQILNVVGVGQPVSAEDNAVVDIDAAAEYLASRRITDIVNQVQDGELDEQWFIPFCEFVAAKYGMRFGKSFAEMKTLEASALEDLRDIEDRTIPVQHLKINWSNP